MKLASWIVTTLFAAYFIYGLIRASKIHTSFGSAAESPAYVFGMFLFCAIVPTIMWVVTYFIEKNKKAKVNHTEKK